jgi:lysine 2,3-aminomutase
MGSVLQQGRGADPGDASEWTDWRWQARNTATTLAGLERALELTETERRGIRHALEAGFPISATPYYLSLCDPHDPDCPIRRQCVPQVDEGTAVAGDLRDPLGEENHEVAPNLVSRYPDRALLLATDRCAVYCRFCTRSRMVGGGVGGSSEHPAGARALAALEPAFAWLRANPQVQDVIVSGGDPAVMSTRRLAAILERLAEIESVLYVRLATRAPVTIPQRITGELCDALRRAHPAVWVMTHFNHPKELTAEAKAACANLVDHGLPVMNQTVLLRGINDDARTLEDLFRRLVRNRVRPYYLLQADPVQGTGHIRTPLRRGVEIMEALQGRLSGIALPKLIVDTPGGRGKVPVGPNYVVQHGSGFTTLRTFRGEHVDYVDPPADEDPSNNAPR